ncbi:unnamed protein product [Lactuca saligna]|uniref:Uncharacterized protein n=1 Tax=Lactuca saligna TaxID=75948 RepID=A0AA35V284_LACSI|nr:unnamed protein product [Lactuca saligna]
MDVTREGEDVGGGVEGLLECVDGGVDWFVGDGIGSCKSLSVDWVKVGSNAVTVPLFWCPNPTTEIEHNRYSTSHISCSVFSFIHTTPHATFIQSDFS